MDWFWTWLYPMLLVTVPAAVLVVLSAEYRAWRDSKKLCPHCMRPWSVHIQGKQVPRGEVLPELRECVKV